MVSFKNPLKAWSNFFFSPRPTEGIAVFRIVWCLLLFVGYLVELTNINDFYGPHAILSLKAVREQFNFLHLNVFHFFGQGYEAVYVIMAVYGVALVSALLGFYTRTSLVIVLICMTSLHQRNIWLLSSSELLMRSITILLACSPCGHSLSVDSLLGRKFADFRKPRDWAPWALRLIQLQVSVVYLMTAWHKLQGEAWLNGTALYYATRIDDMTNFPVPFLFDSMVFLKLATWGTLLLEISLGIFLWVRKVHRPLIFAGILFHLAIEYTMSIPFFELVMIALLLNFFTPEEYRALVWRIRDQVRDSIAASTLGPMVKDKLLWAVKGNDEIL